MITLGDHLIPLAKCSRVGGLPRRRTRRPIHVATWHRWATQGIRGVRLEIIRVGGTRCTTRAAIEEFFRAVTEATQIVGPIGVDVRRDGSASPLVAGDPANEEKECDDLGL